MKHLIPKIHLKNAEILSYFLKFWVFSLSFEFFPLEFFSRKPKIKPALQSLQVSLFSFLMNGLTLLVTRWITEIKVSNLSLK